MLPILTPDLATRFAQRAWPWRWHALGVALLWMGLVAASIALSTPAWLLQATFGLAGPVVGLSWAVLCTATWFHPGRGVLSAASPHLARFPGWLRTLLRWHAAGFLALFVLGCGLVWPLVAVLNLLGQGRVVPT